MVHRAQALAALTAGRRLAAVTGTAGKTSTTSMLTVALQHCGLDPSFAIGGDLAASGSGAHEGSGDVFVAEADESDASFLAFSPAVAVVTNVEADHLDHYGSAEAYVAAFDEFLGRIVPGGRARDLRGRPGRRRARRPGRRGAASGCAATAGPIGATRGWSSSAPTAPAPGSRSLPMRRHDGRRAPPAAAPCPASTWR